MGEEGKGKGAPLRKGPQGLGPRGTSIKRDEGALSQHHQNCTTGPPAARVWLGHALQNQSHVLPFQERRDEQRKDGPSTRPASKLRTHLGKAAARTSVIVVSAAQASLEDTGTYQDDPSSHQAAVSRHFSSQP